MYKKIELKTEGGKLFKFIFQIVYNYKQEIIWRLQNMLKFGPFNYIYICNIK